jgi:hypothetical protein
MFFVCIGMTHLLEILFYLDIVHIMDIKIILNGQIFLHNNIFFRITFQAQDIHSGIRNTSIWIIMNETGEVRYQTNMDGFDKVKCNHNLFQVSTLTITPPMLLNVISCRP